MNFAAGVGAIQGVGEKHYFYEDFSTHPVSQGEEITVIPAKEVFRESSGLPVMPLGKIELVVAVMPAPGLKVKFSGNQPETADGKLK
ncbi:MAG: hypothetical protein Q8R34_02545 [bacterium]|nr:hypothetical protein [bacterium]